MTRRLLVMVGVLAIALGACTSAKGGLKRVAYYRISIAVPAAWTVQGWPLCGGPNRQNTVYEMTPSAPGIHGACVPNLGTRSGSHVWLSVECGTPEGSTKTRVIRGVTVSGPLRFPGEYGVHYLLDPGSIVLAVSGPESQAIVDSINWTEGSSYPCRGIG